MTIVSLFLKIMRPRQEGRKRDNNMKRKRKKKNKKRNNKEKVQSIKIKNNKIIIKLPNQ